MTPERLLNMSIEVLFLPQNFYAPQNKFMATPLFIIIIFLLLLMTFTRVGQKVLSLTYVQKR